MKRLQLIVLLVFCLTSSQVHAAKPEMRLPFAASESWLLTRAYNNGTHTGDDQYALDFTLNGCDAWNKPILAMAAGTVEVQTFSSGYGNHILINHGDGYKSRYAHLESISVSNGQYVQQGQEIGKCGNSGYHEGTACPEHPGTHIHVALYHNGAAEKMEPMQGYQTEYTGFENREGQWHLSDNIGPCAYVSKSPSGTGTYAPGDPITCTITFRNNGSTTWEHSSGNQYVELASCDAGGNIGYSFFNYPCTLPNTGQVSWLHCWVPTTSNESSIAPGQTATYTFIGEIRSDATPGTYDVYFTPVYDGEAIYHGWQVPFTVQVVDPALSGEDFVPFMCDFNGDGRKDACLWDTLNGDWYVSLCDETGKRFIRNDTPLLTSWGAGGGYKLLIGEFYGSDTKEDLCLYHPATGLWFVAQSTGSSFTPIAGPGTNGAWIIWAQGGMNDYIPMAGNYSVDANFDIAVFHPSTGKWFVAYNWNSHNPPEFLQQAGPSPNSWWLDNWYTGEYNTYRPFTGKLVGADSYWDVGLLQPSGGTWHVAANNKSPDRFNSNGQWLTGWASNTAYQHFCGKSSVDNYDDIIVYYPDDGRWFVAYNWSTYFANATGADYNGSWLDDWANENGSYNWQVFVGDISGDGYVDLISYTPLYGRWYVAYNWAGPPPYFAQADGNDDNNSWLNDWGVETGGAPKLVNTDPLPVSYILHQNYPNPFNPVTTIAYSLPEASYVTLDVFNILGQKVATLVNEQQDAGQHVITWEAGQYASGIYLYRLRAGEAVETKKMLLLK